MDKREYIEDPIEAIRLAIEGSLADVWTALPGIVQNFNASAKTVTVQPAIKGYVKQPDGQVQSVNLPLLVDVPVVFSCGGGFVLTFPIAKGDEALVVFASRCIDDWWQNGGIGEQLEPRKHDLSDGFAFVGPFSQSRMLSNIDTKNVQLRTIDGKATVTMKSDYTIEAKNPKANIKLLGDGTVDLKNAGGNIEMSPTGMISLQAKTGIMLNAPAITLAGGLVISGAGGSSGAAKINTDLEVVGSVKAQDVKSGNVSLKTHTHGGVESGSKITGLPQ